MPTVSDETLTPGVGLTILLGSSSTGVVTLPSHPRLVFQSARTARPRGIAATMLKAESMAKAGVRVSMMRNEPERATLLQESMRRVRIHCYVRACFIVSSSYVIPYAYFTAHAASVFSSGSQDPSSAFDCDSACRNIVPTVLCFDLRRAGPGQCACSIQAITILDVWRENAACTTLGDITSGICPARIREP
jgi:hypothetical protein